MDRVRIKDLQLKARNVEGKKITNNDIADHVFEGLKSTRADRDGEELSESRKRSLISEWDNGKSLSALKPVHLLRLADFFNEYDVRELVQSDDRG